MPRQKREDITVNWKIPVTAQTAGRLEFMLSDALHNKPIYGARTKLIQALLEYWIARESAKPEAELPPIPTLLELREAV